MRHAIDLKQKYMPYFELFLSAPGHITLIRSRYEDLVTAFPEWLRRFVESLAPSYTRATRSMLLARLMALHGDSFRPDGKHKRTVKPGMFASHVQPENIELLERAHRDWWTRLGYPSHIPERP